MTPRGFAWRSLRRQPARSLLGALGVAIVGALLLDMLLLSRGLVVSFRDLLDGLGYSVRVLATESLPGAGPPLEDAGPLTADLAALPGFADVIPLRFGQAEWRDVGSTGLFAVGGSRRYPWALLEGDDLADAPRDPPPLMVNRNVAAAADLVPGDTVSLRGRSGVALPFVDFRVAGIAEFPFDAGNSLTVATSLEGYRRAFSEEAGREPADMLMIALAPSLDPELAVATIRQRHPGLYAFSNRDFMQRFASRDFSYFRYVSFALSVLTLFFTFMLVTTLLTVSLNQRLREVATLRALGFPRGWIARELAWESLLMVAFGAAIGLPLGLALSSWLDGILRQLPQIPLSIHFFVFRIDAVWTYAALIGSAALLACLYPVLLAARLPIAATLRKEVVS